MASCLPALAPILVVVASAVGGALYGVREPLAASVFFALALLALAWYALGFFVFMTALSALIAITGLVGYAHHRGSRP